MSDPLRSDDPFQRPVPWDATPVEPPRRNHPMLLPVALIAINVAVWLWNIAQGVSWLSPQTADLQNWGGNIALLTLTEQPWRLFTSMFLHAGVMHLFFNMYFLFQIGPLLVLRKGSIGFAIVYLCGGLLASASSAWWQTHRMFAQGVAPIAGGLPPIKLIVSVGASGAIMAVTGALACSLVMSHYRARAGARRHTEVIAMERQLTLSLLQVIGVNVLMGFFIAGLDQAAHIGGLLAGALLGCVLPDVASRATAAARWLRATVAAGVSTALLAGIWTVAANTPQMQQIREVLRQEAQE